MSKELEDDDWCHYSDMPSPMYYMKKEDMNIYIYKQYGERVESQDDDIHMSAFVPGNQDDAAICKANSKEEAIEKFSKYYEDVTNENVLSLEELYWIPNEDISILTTY
jgi:hypothetical protein